MKDQLVGTWALVSVYNVLDDGKKIYPNGQNAKGRAVFDSSRRFSVIMVNPDLPMYASKNRQQGTPEEFRAVAQGTLTYFGTYSIDEASKAIKFNFEASSFPNMNGTTSDRKITLSGDDFEWETKGAPSGGVAHNIRKKMK